MKNQNGFFVIVVVVIYYIVVYSAKIPWPYLKIDLPEFTDIATDQ